MYQTKLLFLLSVENNDYNGAKKSLQFFRGKKYDITKEFNEISERHESKLRNTGQVF